MANDWKERQYLTYVEFFRHNKHKLSQKVIDEIPETLAYVWGRLSKMERMHKK